MWNWKRNNPFLALFFLFLMAPQLPAQEAELIVYSHDQSLQLVAKQNLGRTRISLLEPQGQGELHSWEIKDFTAETVQFSKSYPKRLLIASEKTIYVYDLSDNKKKLILTQPVEPGKAIVDAGFAEDEQEIYWSTKKELLTSDIKESKPKKVYEALDNQPIKDLTALKDKRVVISQKGNKDLTLINTKKPNSPTILKGHKENVVGVASPDGQNLYSLDEEDELARWDLLNKEVSLKQRLSKKAAKPVAMNLDASGKNILVQYKEDEADSGVKYSIDSIEDLNPKGTRVAFAKGFGKKLFVAPETSQNRVAGKSIQSTFATDKADQNADTATGNTDKNGKVRYFKLAEIEADNQNFEAALRYIKEVPLTSADYAASRKLQREVYSQLEAKAQLAGAMDQYKRGSYDSAKVLVRSTLAKFPKHPIGLRYKKMIEKKEREQLMSSLVTALVLFGGFGLLGLILYRKREKVQVVASGIKNSTAQKPKTSDR
ncbi:MAG: WD40 repeat domain-containing protein, partial [SAR324 cluster bacterium]|nr:WD40 repeat domain-containing protein [SAR324 cluster bacterium]